MGFKFRETLSNASKQATTLALKRELKRHTKQARLTGDPKGHHKVAKQVIYGEIVSRRR